MRFPEMVDLLKMYERYEDERISQEFLSGIENLFESLGQTTDNLKDDIGRNGYAAA